MKTFLQEIAEKIYSQHPKLEAVTIVFPNRRAVLYFRKHLSDLLTKPAFAPRLITIEEYISGYSNLKVPDKLELVAQLYQVYNQVLRNDGSENDAVDGIDQFYFWGEMLLRDFDEVDKYLVDAHQLFKDLSHQKELDSTFDYLTEEQKTFLKNFWGNFDENQSLNKKKFIQLWRQLPLIYKAFRETLEAKGLAYEGMLHRKVAENVTAALPTDGNVYFAGFNALTTAEEKIISQAVILGASVFWDMDTYYVNNISQEAGRFFREYQEHPVLKKTFSEDIPSHGFFHKVDGQEKQTVKLYGAAQPVGQAKIMAQVLREHITAGIKQEETLIVLPDEKLLLPVLHGVAGTVEKMNVTMGLALSSTPLFNFIELLLDLQISRKLDHFNHRQALAILGHPYVVAADASVSNSKRKDILKQNWVHIPKNYLSSQVQLHRLIFREVEVGHAGDLGILTDYLKDIVSEVGKLATIGDLDKEYAFHFYKFINRMGEVLVDPENTGQRSDEDIPDRKRNVTQLKSFLRLFRQLIRSQKIPFSGEPLKGLQVMGVLETRNLDFKNVFILSMNEGAFPAAAAKGSYIPFSIRQAYALPTQIHQDSIYSYLFYRILQRAENVSIFYNSETDVLGQGEMSRYLQQLIFESGLDLEKKVLHNPVSPRGIQPIVVNKNQHVMENIMKLNEGNKYFKGVSPSALNSYIECRLKFYFRHVAKIREADEVEEELDARVLGNFLHDVMEHFYKRLVEKKKSHLIDKDDLEDYSGVVDSLIDKVFIAAYKLDPDKEVTYEGQRLVVKEIVKRFAHRIIEMDKSYAPFSIEGLEQEGLTFTLKIDKPPYIAVVGGKIDRVDRKEDLLRVIDYKTGKDKLNFDSVSALFVRDSKRNKAAFQTLLYALLYKENFSPSQKGKVRVVPGLINRMNLFDDGFSFGLRVGKDQITDVEPLMPEFESGLKQVFEELFDPGTPFDQTNDHENCSFCPYGQICYR